MRNRATVRDGSKNAVLLVIVQFSCAFAQGERVGASGTVVLVANVAVHHIFGGVFAPATVADQRFHTHIVPHGAVEYARKYNFDKLRQTP